MLVTCHSQIASGVRPITFHAGYGVKPENSQVFIIGNGRQSVMLVYDNNTVHFKCYSPDPYAATAEAAD